MFAYFITEHHHKISVLIFAFEFMIQLFLFELFWIPVRKQVSFVQLLLSSISSWMKANWSMGSEVKTIVQYFKLEGKLRKKARSELNLPFSTNNVPDILYLVTFHLYKNPVRFILLSISIREETGAQSDRNRQLVNDRAKTGTTQD